MSYKISNKKLIFTLLNPHNLSYSIILLLMLALFILLSRGEAVSQSDFSTSRNSDFFITNGNSSSFNSFNWPIMTVEGIWATYSTYNYNTSSFNSCFWASSSEVNNIWDSFYKRSLPLHQPVQQPISNTPFVGFDLSPPYNQSWNDPISNQEVNEITFEPFGQLLDLPKSPMYISWEDAIDIIKNEDIKEIFNRHGWGALTPKPRSQYVNQPINDIFENFSEYNLPLSGSTNAPTGSYWQITLRNGTIYRTKPPSESGILTILYNLLKEGGKDPNTVKIMIE